MSDNSTIHREAFWLLCDRKIDGGMSRQVFSSEILPGCVVKVEDDARNFQNVLEWEAWRFVKETAFAKWFAPCRWISPSGGVLVMERTTPAEPRLYPKKMPTFFTDFKRANFGVINGRLVCHDYGTSLLMQEGLTTRLKTVEWWDE